MPRQVLLFSGASAVGKTSVLKSLLPLLAHGGMAPCVCKIDCLKTGDADVFQSLGLPCVTGLSGDICPDHFLVSNLSELWGWADRLGRDALVIETAGLCHRCSPATEHMAAGCVLDCTASCRAPGQLGPMLTQADFVVLTKIDMVSQAELEIISWQIRILNPSAALFPSGRAGRLRHGSAGTVAAGPAGMHRFREDALRHTMPSGVCSLLRRRAAGGQRVQQGVVGKISFEEAPVCGV